MNLRQQYYSKVLLEESLYSCNALKVYSDVLATLCHLLNLKGNEEDCLKALIAIFNINIVALTKGRQGSLLPTPNGYSIRKTPRVNVADAVGAGHSFTAAMVMGMLMGLPLGGVHELAVGISAYVCTQHGAMAALPDALKPKGVN